MRSGSGMVMGVLAVIAMFVSGCAGGSHFVPANGPSISGNGAGVLPLSQVNAAQLDVIESLSASVDSSGLHFTETKKAGCQGKGRGFGDGDRDDATFSSKADVKAKIAAFTVSNPCAKHHEGEREEDSSTRAAFAAPAAATQNYYIFMQTVPQNVRTVIAGPGAVSGKNLAFPAAAAPVALKATQTYAFYLARTTAVLATPTPPPVGCNGTYAGIVPAPTLPLPSPIPLPVTGVAAPGLMTFYPMPNGDSPDSIACGPNTKMAIDAGPHTGIYLFDTIANTFALLSTQGGGIGTRGLAADSLGNVDIVAIPPGPPKSNGTVYQVTSASATRLTLPAPFVPSDMATASDGSVYSSGNTNLGSGNTGDIVHVNADASTTEFTMPAGCASYFEAMTLDQNGNFWVYGMSSNPALPCGLVEFTPSSGAYAGPYDLGLPVTRGANADCVTAGPDGAIYFITSPFTNTIKRFDTTAHTVSSYALPASDTGVYSIATGSDGNLWFSASGTGAAAGGVIGRLNIATGAVTEWGTTVAGSNDPTSPRIPHTNPELLTNGPDGMIYGVVPTSAQQNVMKINPALAGP